MSRKLPHSTEAEQSILGAMMIYPSVTSVVYDQGLDVRDFHLDIHQRVFSAMMDITDSGKPMDVTTLIARSRDIGQLNLADGTDYIIKPSGMAISSANGMYYIGMIKNRAHLRRLIEAAEQIAEDGFDMADDLDRIMDKAGRDILGVTRNRHATDFKSSRKVVSSIMQELIRLRPSGNRIIGVRTSYTGLGRTANGFQRSDLAIFAARPAVGKTAFTLNLALNAPFYSPGIITIFSPEIPAEALIKRILSAKSTVEPNKLRNGAILDDEFSKLSETADELVVSKLFVDDSSNIKIFGVFSKCRKLESEHGPDLVVADYLQLISGSGKSRDNRQQEISEVSHSLRGLAREIKCSVIAFSQLSHSVETRPNKYPMLSDLHESGVTKQDADVVMFLYHDAYYTRGDETEQNNPTDQADLDIVKYRDGATSKVELVFQKSVSASFNIAHDGFSQCRIIVI